MQRSRDRCGFCVWLLLSALLLCLTAPAAMATEADMNMLPVVDPFRCAICHVEAAPSSAQHDLNVFGLDFLSNGRSWNAALAALDSDGDGCSNGVELGDANGDGIADGGVTELTSNPGVPGDCWGELVIDARTWGALKALFDRR